MFSSVSAAGTSNGAAGWISCSLLKSAIWVGCTSNRKLPFPICVTKSHSSRATSDHHAETDDQPTIDPDHLEPFEKDEGDVQPGNLFERRFEVRCYSFDFAFEWNTLPTIARLSFGVV